MKSSKKGRLKKKDTGGEAEISMLIYFRQKGKKKSDKMVDE